MKVKAAVLPLMLGIALAVVSLTMPWMIAQHSQVIAEQDQTVDTLVYYMWGQEYTVNGPRTVLSNSVIYDYKDFPFYGMLATITAIGLGALTILSGRGTVIHARGHEFKFRAKFNPIIMLLIASVLMIFTWWYLQISAQGIIPMIEGKGYIVRDGPSMDFLLGGFASFSIATIMTFRKSMKRG
ncbi:MAG: hypothetical protein K0A90_05815 [Methanosarcinaceae archaeon]|nr:hypothetical protein [Methanosarcinaceae archaeon]